MKDTNMTLQLLVKQYSDFLLNNLLTIKLESVEDLSDFVPISTVTAAIAVIFDFLNDRSGNSVADVVGLFP